MSDKPLTITFAGAEEKNRISMSISNEINKPKTANISIENLDGSMRDSYGYSEEVVIDVNGTRLFTGKIQSRDTTLRPNGRTLDYTLINHLAPYQQKYTTQDYSAGSSAKVIMDAMLVGIAAGERLLTNQIGTNGTIIKIDLQDEVKTLLQTINLITKITGYEYTVIISGDTKYFRWREPLSLVRGNVTDTHIYEVGKNIVNNSLKRDKLRVKNAIKVKGDGVDSGWRTDGASISTYGRREKVVSDSSLKDATSCETYADALLDSLKDEQDVISFEIAGGDETINVGDVIGIIDTDGGFPEDEFYRITKINWSYDSSGFKTKVHCSNVPFTVATILQFAS